MFKKIFIFVSLFSASVVLSTKLHDACKGSDPFTVKKLIVMGYSLNAVDSKGQTPLFSPCSFSWWGKLSINFAEQLLRAGANPNHQDKNGNTPLHTACAQTHNNNLVFLLLEYGASPYIKNHEGNTALHEACQKHTWDAKSIHWLLLDGADVYARNQKQETPLHLACKEIHKATELEILLQFGANPHAVDSKGNTPLDNCVHIICKDAQDVQNRSEMIVALQQYS